MLERTLEDEFEIYKNEHKKRILQAKMTIFYRDKNQTGVKIPFFMTKTPEKRAEEDVEKLFNQSPFTFNELYERAWCEFAECLP